MVAVVLSLAACNDFLDIQPVGKVMPHTAQEFRDLLTEAYSFVPTDRGKTVYRSDELVLNQATTTTEGLDSYLDIWRWQDGSEDETTESFNWRTFYYVSYIANTVIEQKDAITESICSRGENCLNGNSNDMASEFSSRTKHPFGLKPNLPTVTDRIPEIYLLPPHFLQVT